MEIRHVRVFREVVEQGGFSRAAKSLGATQSTVSKAVAQLEHDCGSPLLDRSGRKPSMTPAGEIELGITLPPLVKGCVWEEIYSEPVMALLPPGFAWPKGKPIRLRQLAQERFILFEEGFALNAIIITACRKRGFLPVEAARSGQADFIMALVAAGLGVAFLPRLVVEVQRRLPIRAVLLDESDLRWTPGLIWRRGHPLSPAAQAWFDLLRESFPKVSKK